MSVTININLPRVEVPAQTKTVLRTLLPFAVPALMAAVEASGVGLVGRILLGGAIGAAEDALRG